MQPTFSDTSNKVLVKVKYLKPKMVLNCPTYNSKGEIVHPAYTPFSQKDISTLLSAGVNEIYYSKQKAEKHQPAFEKNLKNYLNAQVFSGPRSIKVETQKKAVQISEKLSNAVKSHSEINFNDTQDVIEDIFADINTSNEEFINLLDIQAFDDFTHSHSLNVGVIAMAFAKKLDMNEEQIKEVGMAGFLHDLGKIRLPYALLHKKGGLENNEFQIIKKHPRYSYEIVKMSKNLSENTKKAILLHHEKYDGSGYPFGFKGDQIEDAVYVVAIAEFYDALTTKLSYKEAITSKEALKYVMQNAGKHFKPELAHRFAKSIGKFCFKESSFYHIGCHVLLDSNEIAKVISKDSEITSRPRIEIIKNSEGRTLARPIFIDLNYDVSRKIVRILNESNYLFN